MLYIYVSMHVAETQARPTVSHIGIQCELLLPQAPITSTPTKASTSTSKPTISSDISDVDDDINDEGGTDADISILHNRHFMKIPSVRLNLSQICLLKNSKHI